LPCGLVTRHECVFSVFTPKTSLLASNGTSAFFRDIYVFIQ
jgi:hypothetical protein